MEIKINLKIFAFAVIFYLTGQIKIYGILMIFAFIHELGHLIMGVLLGFRPRSLKIMPLGLAICFSAFPKDYNCKIKKTNQLTIKKMVIAMAGPITNLLLIIAFLLNPSSHILGIDRIIMIYSNLLIAIFNLIPIYPLDGGRILKYIICLEAGRRKASAYINTVSNFTISILTMIASVIILYYKNIAILLTLIYLWILVIMQNKRYDEKTKLYKLIKNNT